jgi:hypothetical protein
LYVFFFHQLVGTFPMKAVATTTGPDGLLIALVVGIVGLVVGIGFLGAVVFANIGARTLVGAWTATVAATLALLVSLYFDLRGKTETAFMSAEYTVDRLKPQIRQWAYPNSGAGWRITAEVGASDTLAGINPKAFKDDLAKLTSDMTIRSLLAYFFAEQFDWQLKQTVVRGATSGTWTSIEPLSKSTECTVFTSTEILDKLAKAGNLFARSGNFMRQQVCFPPGSKLDISPASLSLTSPFLHLSFVVESTGGVMYGKPRTGGLDAPSLPDGTPQFETRANNVRAVVEYSWIRAQHPDLQKYKSWVDRVVSSAQTWFQGTP